MLFNIKGNCNYRFEVHCLTSSPRSEEQLKGSTTLENSVRSGTVGSATDPPID